MEKLLNIKQGQLVNLNFSLDKELIRSNRAGSYASTTLAGCNTRKYHGLLISPLEDGSKHLFISELEETIVQKDKSFNLGIRQYEDGTFFPHGHTYATEFGTEHIPYKIFSVGGVRIKKEQLLTLEEARSLIRYTILDLHTPTKLRLKPFLAFRSIHEVKRANMNANVKSESIPNGIKSCLYQGYPDLHMQLSRQCKFVSAPDWNYNIQYSVEKERGYEYLEDLFVPGYFEIDIKKDDVIVFSAGLEETDTKTLTKKFVSEIKSRTPRTDFESSLKNSAEQFFVFRKTETLFTAGYHWYRFMYREALNALPGLTLSVGDNETFIMAFDSIAKKFDEQKQDISPDIALLIFRNLQQYFEYSADHEMIWEKYGKLMIKTLSDFNTERFYTTIKENGLLYISEQHTTRTWMNETVNGVPVTPRFGYTVELNALWYNALRFFEQISALNNFKLTKATQKGLADKVAESFPEIFWNAEDKCLYDFVTIDFINKFIRPNQIFAASLPYSPLSDLQKAGIAEKVKNDLLTERGLRSLCPKNMLYKAVYTGTEAERHGARHQGTIHPWLLGPFCEAWLRIYSKDGLYLVSEIYEKMKETIYEGGLGTISELYSGAPPYEPKGAISYAPSVAELLRIKMLMDKYSG